MATHFDLDAFDDALPSIDDPDSPMTEWTLDDLDASADLGSVRSAWTRAYDANES